MTRSNNRHNNKLKNLATTLGSMLVVLTIAFMVLSYTNVRITSANSTSSNVAASANVQSYCELGGAPQTIAFGTYPGSGGSYDTNSLITANTIGNAAGNILVSGTTWAYLSNSFAVGSTDWSASSQSSFTGTPLTGTPTDTNIAMVPLPAVIATNDIYFGVNVPAGENPDTYTQTITLKNSCSGSANTFSVTATLTVSGSCYVSVSNSVISFGNINPGSNTPDTSNLVVVQDNGGNVNANILVEGSSWTSGANNFFVANTVWDSSNVAYTSGTSLELAPGNLINTNIEIPYPPTNGANNIYFGVAVPPGEPAGVYTQNIVLENLC